MLKKKQAARARESFKNIDIIILFGSQVTGRITRRSDIDIAVLGKKPLNLSQKTQLTEQLAKKFDLPEDQIDLVDLWSASPLLQHEVAETGRLLIGKKYNFVRFRVLAWKRYLDTAKFRRAREKLLEKKLS